MNKFLAAACFALFSLNALAAEPVTLAINEGDSGQATAKDLRDKYKDLAQLISRAINREVNIVAANQTDRMRRGLAESKFDLAMVHPAHVALAATDSGNYHLVALTKGHTDYRARFLVAGNSPVNSISDLKGLRVVTPEADSDSTVIGRAIMRDAGVLQEAREVKAVKSQDAVAYFLTNGYADVGVVGSDSVAREWVAKGGKIIYESKPIPVKHVIASSRLTPEEIGKIRATLIDLGLSPQGRKILEQIGQQGFTPADQKQLATHGKWLMGA